MSNFEHTLEKGKIQESSASGCNTMSFDNEQISKQSPIQLPRDLCETFFLPENLLTSVPNLSASFTNESNSPFANTITFMLHLPSGQILVVSSAACDLLNYNSEELCSMKLDNLVNDSDQYKLTNLFEKFLKPLSEIPQSSGKLLEFVKKNGETISVFLHFKKTENHENCLAIVKPLARKTGLILIDKNGQILSCNEESASIFDFDLSDIVGKSIYTFLPSVNISAIKKENKDFIKQYITGRTTNGIVFPVTVTVGCENSNEEVFECLICVHTNVKGLILLNKKLLITNFNSSFMKILFGYSKKDIVDQFILKLIPTFSKDIGFEKNRKSYQNNVTEPNLAYKSERNELFENWSENSVFDEYLNTWKSIGSSASVKSLINSEKNESSNTNLKFNSETDDDLKILFKNDGVKTELIPNYQDPPFSNGFSAEEKNILNHNIKPNCDDFENDQTNYNDVVVQEGNFMGIARHKDGGYIEIEYQIQIVALNEENFYGVLLSRKSFGLTDLKSSLRGNMNISCNSTSVEGSLPKDDSCSGQCTRPSSASVISQSDETLTAGEYSLHYTNIRQIGKGAFGCVKMAYRNSDGFLVVTKFIKKKKINVRSWVFHPSLNMRIPLEISLLTTLHHPNIVKVLDVFHNDSFVQLVMEKHGAGFDLFEFINREPKCDEKLKSYIFSQIISAVHYLDSLGIIHRDIKDENVIINENFEIKLIDFGSATFIPSNETFSKFYGTFEYCSPEVLQGNAYKGPELEIWALGVTLYILSFGENPFCNVEETIKGEFLIPVPISKELNNLLHRMLDKNVETRITIAEVVKDPWINQPVAIENYRFEEVVRCSHEEAYPPKYVQEINSKQIRKKYKKTNSFLSEDNSKENLESLTEIDNLNADDSFKSQNYFELGISGHKTSLSPVMYSSTPMKQKNGRLSKSATGLAVRFKHSSLSDNSYECQSSTSVENEFVLRHTYLKHCKNTSSSGNESDGAKEDIALPAYNDISETDLEMRLKNCLIEEENLEIDSSSQI